MEEIYQWEYRNNMKYNGEKVMNLRIGPNSSTIKNNTILFILGYVEPIKES